MRSKLCWSVGCHLCGTVIGRVPRCSRRSSGGCTVWRRSFHGVIIHAEPLRRVLYSVVWRFDGSLACLALCQVFFFLYQTLWILSLGKNLKIFPFASLWSMLFWNEKSLFWTISIAKFGKQPTIQGFYTLSRIVPAGQPDTRLVPFFCGVF